MIVAAGVSKGIGISKAKLVNRKANEIKKYKSVNIDSEIAKLDYCIKETDHELRSFYSNLSQQGNDPVLGMLDKYMSIINNVRFQDDLKEMVIKDGSTAEFAILSIMDRAEHQLRKLDDEYLNEKCQDIEEIKNRLLGKLRNIRALEIRNISEECILVAEDFTPSEVLSMDPEIIKGIVTIWGGPTSSAALMIRQMNIPTVTGIGSEGYSINDGDILIVDGNRGKVIVNPDDAILKSYS